MKDFFLSGPISFVFFLSKWRCMFLCVIVHLSPLRMKFAGRINGESFDELNVIVLNLYSFMALFLIHS